MSHHSIFGWLKRQGICFPDRLTLFQMVSEIPKNLRLRLCSHSLKEGNLRPHKMTHRWTRYPIADDERNAMTLLMEILSTERYEVDTDCHPSDRPGDVDTPSRQPPVVAFFTSRWPGMCTAPQWLKRYLAGYLAPRGKILVRSCALLPPITDL